MEKEQPNLNEIMNAQRGDDGTTPPSQTNLEQSNRPEIIMDVFGTGPDADSYVQEPSTEEERFTIKHNGEEKQFTRQELINYAQKGFNYEDKMNEHKANMSKVTEMQNQLLQMLTNAQQSTAQTPAQQQQQQVQMFELPADIAEYPEPVQKMMRAVVAQQNALSQIARMNVGVVQITQQQKSAAAQQHIENYHERMTGAQFTELDAHRLINAIQQFPGLDFTDTRILEMVYDKVFQKDIQAALANKARQQLARDRQTRTIVPGEPQNAGLSNAIPKLDSYDAATAHMMRKYGGWR